MRKTGILLAVVLLGSALASGPVVGQSIVQPGAPGEPSRSLSSGEIGDAAPNHPHTEADVRFMQGMIPHHDQAVEMVALVEGRTENRAIILLAERIRISQRDEIVLMKQWLAARGESAPAEEMAHHHHHHGAEDHHALMPGMLTDAQMGELAGATGDEFDRLFLTFMIQHHEGALLMVRDLFASEGGGHELEIWRFANHVDADQRVEIDRMARMLGAMR